MFKTKLSILLACLACCFRFCASAVPLLDGRIVGGSMTSIIYFPWQISLQRYGYHSCGGSIYNNDTIVTAAHCVQDIETKYLRVRAGSTYRSFEGSVVQAKTIKTHPQFNPATLQNDIAIVRLASSLTYSSKIQPINLAKSTPPNGTNALVSGWGALKENNIFIPEILHYVNVKIVGPEKCKESYGGILMKGMMCAAAHEKDACQGDSGGPLVFQGNLIGIVSWGSGCARSEYPGVYTDVADYRSWVVDNAATL